MLETYTIPFFGGGGRRMKIEISFVKCFDNQSEKHFCSDDYFNSIFSMEQIRITGMTRQQFNEYAAHGEAALKALPFAVDEWKEESKRLKLDDDETIPHFVPPRDYLPDMYMRWGQWDDALRVIETCRAIDGILPEPYGEQRITDCLQKRDATQEVIKILKDNLPCVKQDALKKQLVNFDRKVVNWVLRFQKSIVRTKAGSSFIVSLSAE